MANLPLPRITQAEFDGLPHQVLEAACDTAMAVIELYLRFRITVIQQLDALPLDLHREAKEGDVRTVLQAHKWLQSRVNDVKMTFDHKIEPVKDGES